MSSSWGTFLRIVRLGWKNFWRNRWLTIGAALLMTLTLTMITVSLLMTFLLHDTASIISSKIDLTVYFRDDTVPDAQIIALGDRVKTAANVVGVHFVNKAEALQIWDRLPLNSNIKSPVNTNNNPLPRSLEIKTDDPSTIAQVVTVVQADDTGKIVCNECVSYVQNKDTVNRLLTVTRFVQWTGIGLSLFFGIIAIFNVLNIIRITITARADEIEIMRFVGASNAFVRGPFIIEGIMYGLLGTLLTTGFLLLVTAIASSAIGANVSFLQLLNVNLFRYVLNHLWVLVGVQLLIGILLGVIVSLLSIRRYLKA